MKTVNQLADSDIAKAKPKVKPYYLRDAHRLSVLISTAGSKTWVWGYRSPNGKDRVLRLGEFPAMSASAARKCRMGLVEKLKAGIDPREEQQAEQAAKEAEQQNTLWPVAIKWLAQRAKLKKWSAYYEAQAGRFLRRYVENGIGKMPIRNIGVSEIYELLSSIASREQPDKAIGEVKSGGAPHIAVRLRHHLDGVFQLAILLGRADRNPVQDVALSNVVAHKPKTKHNTKLKPDQLGNLLVKLDCEGGTERTRIGLRLLLLTLTRTGELRGASWPEFDLDKGLWVIPAERMKMRVEHIVPLSTQAVMLLRELQKYGNKGLLFPNVKTPGKPMDANTFNRALERLGFSGKGTVRFTCHGSRGTASTLLNGMLLNGVRKYPRDVIEAQLAHKVRGVEGAYNDAGYLDQRIPMMQDWANYLDNLRAGATSVEVVEPGEYAAADEDVTA